MNEPRAQRRLPLEQPTPPPAATRPEAGGAPGNLDWDAVGRDLDRDGYALTAPLLTPGQCAEVRALFEDGDAFRSTVDMARHRFGAGTYRYFAHPLPEVVARLRRSLYPPLAVVANSWAARLDRAAYPPELEGLTARCAAAGQRRPTPLLLRYGPGDYNCLHQDLYGDVAFPLQVAVMLSRPGIDFRGGESVFVEQRPRAQSRPMVAQPAQGQALVFAVNERPVARAGSGFRRVRMRHGVSEVREGRRFVLGIIFHDAA